MIADIELIYHLWHEHYATLSVAGFWRFLRDTAGQDHKCAARCRATHELQESTENLHASQGGRNGEGI